MEWKLTLDVRSGPDEGLRFQYVIRSEIVFGREGEKDAEGLRPSDLRVSRKHLTLAPDEAGVKAAMLSSQRRFLHNDRKVGEATLVDGDRIRLGASTYAVALRRMGRDDEEGPDPTALAAETTTDNITVNALSDLELLDEIGRGAMGRVLRARDKAGRNLCVKLVRQDFSDPKSTDAIVPFFLREMDLLGALVHPNIVRTLYAGPAEGEMYLGMEWVDGRNLEQEVTVAGKLPLLDGCAVGRQLLSALVCAHEHDVVHRDVKPDNVMIRGERGALHAILIDFGLARIVGEAGDEGLTATGEARGSYAYSPLECLADAKRAKPPADLFGAAATLYFALTGSPYYDEELAAQGMPNVFGGKSIVPLRERRDDAPESLARVIEKGLAIEPEDRWSSAAEMLERLVVAEGEVLRASANTSEAAKGVQR